MTRLHLLGAFSLAVGCVTAFSDASPYLLVSTQTPIHETRSIIPSSRFLATAKQAIARCDVDAFVLVSQPGLHISDLSGDAVHLKDLLSETPGWVADHVFADSAAEDMGGVIETLQAEAVGTCGAAVEGVDAKTAAFKPFDGARPSVIRVDFEALPMQPEERRGTMQRHDAFLKMVLELLPTRRFVLVLASSPISDTAGVLPAPAAAAVEKHQEALELRSVDVQEEAGKNETTGPSEGLFHRYQFFTPAILMGYVALAVLLLVLYVGLSAISSVQVSYGSFEKEMGPAAQAAKKQQ